VPIQSAWGKYLRLLDTHPVSTKSITAAVLSVVSDFIAQLMLGATLLSVNTTSLFHQFLCGLFLRGPWVHYWYLALDWVCHNAQASQINYNLRFQSQSKSSPRLT
jgi:hypothetical protein